MLVFKQLFTFLKRAVPLRCDITNGFANKLCQWKHGMMKKINPKNVLQS
jgi:hypothetical protein